MESNTGVEEWTMESTSRVAGVIHISMLQSKSPVDEIEGGTMEYGLNLGRSKL